MSRRRLLPLAVCLIAAGCHPQAIDAPSLGQRAVERQPIELPDAAAEPATPADAALTAKLDQLMASAEAAHRRFEGERAAAEAALRRAGRAPEGSELWIQAQQALSGLDGAQGALRDAAAEIAGLRSDPANYGSGARVAIDAAAAKVDAMQDAESRSIAALSGR